MSIKKPQLFFYLFLIIGFSFYQYTKPAAQKRRSFAGGINISEYSSHGVVDRVISLKIETSETKNSQTDVVAIVTLPFDFENELHYKWTLRQDVVLKEGLLVGTTAKNSKKEIAEKIKISVQGYSPDKLRHIGFEIYGEKNGRRIFADGLISSQKNNSFEKTVQKNSSGIKK